MLKKSFVVPFVFSWVSLAFLYFEPIVTDEMFVVLIVFYCVSIYFAIIDEI